MFIQRQSGRLATTIVGMLTITWGLFLAVSSFGTSGEGRLGFGLALTAFFLGVRHAFDADHIAAIDNTSRKLIDSGRDSSSVGVWFAFGHSSVVVGAVCLAIGGASAAIAQVGNDSSYFSLFTSAWGPSVSGVFLLVIAAVNLSSLIRIFRNARNGQQYRGRTHVRGFVSHVLAKTSASVDKPWKMYIVGLLFGLGFDTASSITLLVIAGGAGVNMPWYEAVLAPLLFAAGMVTCDGINSAAMARIYAWTITRPDNRVRYNVVLLTISIVLAVIVGAAALSGVMVERVGVPWAPLTSMASLPLDDFGYIAVGTLGFAWMTSWLFARAQKSAPSVSRTADKDARVNPAVHRTDRQSVEVGR